MKITQKKIILFVTGILLLIFTVWNITWFVYVAFKYTPYTELVPKDKYGSHHIVDSDGYNFNVEKPIYLFFTGNLAAVAPGAACTLVIWPEVFGGYEYGLRVEDESGGYEIIVDSNGNALRLDGQSDNEFEQSVAVIEKNRESIQKIFEKANNLWALE